MRLINNLYLIGLVCTTFGLLSMVYADPTPTLPPGDDCPYDSKGLTQNCFCSSTGETIYSGENCP